MEGGCGGGGMVVVMGPLSRQGSTVDLRKDHWVRSSRAFPEGEVTDSSGNSWGQGS